MKHIFIVAGEASGDALAAWYLKQKAADADVQYAGVVGPQMRACGVNQYADINDLSVVGVIEIIKQLPDLLKKINAIADHIAARGYDEVVLVDFPGFNLRLLKKIKANNPAIKVTYLSPPQLWVWGSWRVKKLRAVDRLIVLYPFEVKWYQQHGIIAEWIGSPVVDRIDQATQQYASGIPAMIRSNQIALLPGSRRQEIISLMPLYCNILSCMSDFLIDGRIVVIVAPNLTEDFIRGQIKQCCPELLQSNISFITESNMATYELTRSICALTKPGTNTLELALLGVPAVVVYKTSWLTYWIARMLVNVTSMTLPNLLLAREVCPEFIQKECQPDVVARQLEKYVAEYQHGTSTYTEQLELLSQVRKTLCRLR